MFVIKPSCRIATVVIGLGPSKAALTASVPMTDQPCGRIASAGDLM